MFSDLVVECLGPVRCAGDRSFCAEVVDTGRAVTVGDAAVHAIYSQNPMVLSGAVGAYAGVPLVTSSIVLGSVAVVDDRRRVFSVEVLDILRHQGTLAGSVLARRRCGRDALTGLPNRTVYGDRLAGALARLERRRGMVCVMYLDIDDFKSINDTFGHGGGDDVLVELGRRLTSVMRPADTLSRFGGDEFVILCEGLSSVREAQDIAARMVAAISEPWTVQDRRTSVHVSIGVAVTNSSRASEAVLVGDADAAMYVAKKARGSATVLAPGR